MRGSGCIPAAPAVAELCLRKYCWSGMVEKSKIYAKACQAERCVPTAGGSWRLLAKRPGEACFPQVPLQHSAEQEDR